LKSPFDLSPESVSRDYLFLQVRKTNNNYWGIQSIKFNNNGTKLFVLDSGKSIYDGSDISTTDGTNGAVYQYNLSTPFDISSVLSPGLNDNIFKMLVNNLLNLTDLLLIMMELRCL